jgi:hypothetical protein
MSQYVSGTQRPNFFKRPLVPLLQEPNIQISPAIAGNTIHAELVETQKKIEPKSRTVEVQTDYRESETQTDPFTPNYVVRDGETPEVLGLQKLKWGEGLPAGFDELEAIELNREKSAFDYALPPTSDEASFNLRSRLMQDQEVREWKKREDQMKTIQNERMNVLKSALIEREKDVEEKNAQRIEDIKMKKTEQKNRLIAKIQRRKIKILRKLQKNRKNEDKVDFKREIIEEYHNFASTVYAGIAREGLSIDKISNKYEVQPIALTTYQGTTELAITIPKPYIETKVSVQTLTTKIQKAYNRQEILHKIDLKKAHQMIAGRKEAIEEKNKDNRYNAPPQLRPDTPERFFDNKYALLKPHTTRVQKYAGEEKRELAIVLIQRLLRGRAKQNMMYDGKEKRLALIEELLIVANVAPLSANEVEERLLQAHEERLKDAVIETIQGDVMARTFDMLSKELLKMKQEKKIAKMVGMAENDRRVREADERGRRQAEQVLEHREDVLYGEVMRVHQGTVDTFLNVTFGNALEIASSRQAGMMAKLRKEKVDTQIENLENKSSKPQSVIRDLLLAFLIPNIQRNKIQEQIQVEEKRFAETAKKSLKQSLTQTIGTFKQ